MKRGTDHIFYTLRAPARGWYRRHVQHRPVIEAIDWLQQHKDDRQRFVSPDAGAPIEGLVRGAWRELILEKHNNDLVRVNRINYEICVLQLLREKLRYKEIWVVGADRYRNPDDDLPLDFEEKRASYYQALEQPEDAQRFIATVRERMQEELEQLDKALSTNQRVRLRNKGKNRIVLSPLPAQPLQELERPAKTPGFRPIATQTPTISRSKSALARDANFRSRGAPCESPPRTCPRGS